ncbi:MAG: flagellar hook-associated protein 1 FlgK [Bradymonadia bacterium]|jgi:flagellar hook-associated protein 1 FlgK
MITGLYQSAGAGAGSFLTHQNRVALIQQNVANASTPGYRRQRADLQTLSGSVGVAGLAGVSLGSARSISSPLTDTQLVHQLGAFGYANAKAEAGAVAEAFFDPIDGVDLSGKATEFFSALRGLSSNPAGQPERREALSRADGLATAFRRTAGSLTDAQTDIRAQIGTRVEQANNTLKRVADLDQAALEARRSGQPDAELVDERDRLVGELAETLQLRVATTDDGTLHLAASGGLALVESGRARSLVVTETAGDVSIALDSGVGSPQNLNSTGGALGGLVDTHNTVIGEQLATLDQLAFDFATEMNTLHSAGVGTDGAGGRALFDIGATQAGSAATIALSSDVAGQPSAFAAATSAADLPGGSDLLQTMIAVEEQTLSNGETFASGLIGVAQEVGTAVRTSLDDAAAAQIAVGQLEILQSQVSGVSLEEELLSLESAQRAYEASLRVFEATNDMLDLALSLGA